MPTTSEQGLTARGALQPGTIVGSYRIVRHVGEGSWAHVYEALDTRLNRRIALKVLKPEQQHAGERLGDEVRNVAQLRHPGIITLFDYGETDGVFYLAMEWVEGRSLARLLEDGLMPWRDAAALTRALAAALAHAHDHQILHRDLKPQNVLLRADGSPVLTDFGVAGTLLNSTGQTQTGFVVGTPRYMASEQLYGRAHSPATDVFGLGLLFYEMLFGSLPDAGSVQELLISRATRQIIVPPRADLPPALTALLQHMLQLNAADRPASASAVVARIDQLISAGNDFGPSLAPPPVRAPVTVETSVAAPRSTGGLLATIAAAVVLLLVGATIFVVFATAGTTTRFVLGLLQGVLLIAAGVFGGRLLSRALAARRSQFDREAGHVLSGTRDRSALTRTIAFQVDELIARTHAIDAHVLGATIVQMVHEYDEAKESSDRQAALMNTAQLLEKLMHRLSPWYVRHDKAIAFAVSAVGIVAGVVKIVSDLVKLAAGG